MKIFMDDGSTYVSSMASFVGQLQNIGSDRPLILNVFLEWKSFRINLAYLKSGEMSQKLLIWQNKIVTEINKFVAEILSF